MARCVALEMRQICEDCRNAVLHLYDVREDERMYMPYVTQLEELAVIQEYREDAVERFFWMDWETVHNKFDRTYAEVCENHKYDALPYI